MDSDLLDLLAGLTCDRAGSNSFNNELLPLVRLLRDESGGLRLFRTAEYGRAALRKLVHAVPTTAFIVDVRDERQPSDPKDLGSVSVRIGLKALLDWMFLHAGVQEYFKADRLRIGVVMAADGAKLTSRSGVVAYTIWFLNFPDLCQSTRVTFTLALSNGSDSLEELARHGVVIQNELAQVKHWVHPLTGQSYEILHYRNGDGKDIRMW